MTSIGDCGSDETERSRRERQPVRYAPRAHVAPAGDCRDRECARPLPSQEVHEPPPVGSAGSQLSQTASLKPPYALWRLVSITFQAAAPANPIKAVSKAYSIMSCPSVSTARHRSV